MIISSKLSGKQAGIAIQFVISIYDYACNLVIYVHVHLKKLNHQIPIATTKKQLVYSRTSAKYRLDETV